MEKVTVESLTDAQIEALSRQAAEAGDESMVRDCDMALMPRNYPEFDAARAAEARRNIVRALDDAQAQRENERGDS